MFVWQRDTGGLSRKSQIRAVVITVVAAALSIFTSVNFQQRVDPIQHAKSSTMLVATPTGYGSGVIVERISSSGRRVFLWTAAHVVSDSPLTVKAKLLFRNSEGFKAGEGVFDATLLGLSIEDDIALYWVNVPDQMVEDVQFAELTPQPIGSEIFHIGNFLGPNLDNSLTRGVISQHNIHPALEGWPWTIADQADLAVLPGGSGGGVFRQSDGRVVGLMVGGFGPTSVTVIVPTRLISAWATKNGLGWAVTNSVCPSDDVLVQAAQVAALEVTLPDVPIFTP